jgi:hypothetical protein
MALFASINVMVIWSKLLRPLNPRLRTIVASVALGICLCWFLGCRWWAAKQTYRPEGYPWQVMIGLQTPEENLQSLLPEYSALCHLANEAESGGVKVLAYPRHLRLYGGGSVFYHRLMSPDHPLEFGADRVPVSDEEVVAKALTDKGIKYLLLTYDREFKVAPEYPAVFMERPFLEKYCRPILSRDGWYHRRVCLYEFLPSRVSSQ